MKTERILIVVLVLALLFTAGMQLGLAQDPGTAAQVQDPGTAAQPEDPDAGSQPDLQAAVQPAREAGIAAVLQDRIPIQGRLTDASGNPLNGNYNVTFALYAAAVGGPVLCQNLTATVAVDRGLFNHTIDLCDTANAIEGDQLYLGVKVGADPEMTPRQPIFSVPYAFTVKPGAVIKGGTSYVFVPGTAFIKETQADTTRWDLSGASAVIYRGSTAGTKNIRIPITIPAVLYGQPVRVTQVTVYYKCLDGTQSYISETQLYKQTDADSFVSLIDDNANRQSNTAATYTLSTDAAVNTLSAGEGLLTLRLALAFANDSQYVQIGGVRLTLVTNY